MIRPFPFIVATALMVALVLSSSLSCTEGPASPLPRLEGATPAPTHLLLQVPFVSDVASQDVIDEIDRGREFLKQGNYGLAEVAFKSAIQRHGEPSASIENKIGGIYRRFGEYEIAIEHYRKSLSMSESLGTHISLAQTAIFYVAPPACTLGIESAQIVLEHPAVPLAGGQLDSHYDAHLGLGICSSLAGESSVALDHLVAALELAQLVYHPSTLIVERLKEDVDAIRRGDVTRWVSALDKGLSVAEWMEQ